MENMVFLILWGFVAYTYIYICNIMYIYRCAFVFSVIYMDISAA